MKAENIIGPASIVDKPEMPISEYALRHLSVECLP